MTGESRSSAGPKAGDAGPVDRLRGTGRTIRMLGEAVAAAEKGGRVLVVVASSQEADRIGYLLRRNPEIAVVSMDSDPRGIVAEVFVDHYVYETLIARFDHAWRVSAVREGDGR